MNLERTILESLNLVHPRMLTTRTLLADLRIEDIEVTNGDMEQALRKLEGKQQVIRLTGEDATRIKITAAGQARLLE